MTFLVRLIGLAIWLAHDETRAHREYVDSFDDPFGHKARMAGHE